jgi:Flp pilus assembly protein TadG
MRLRAAVATSRGRRKVDLVASRCREERGVALTEMAVVLPLLLLLLLGMIDFGKAINYWIDETHLANSGARWAVVNYNPGDPTNTGIATTKPLQVYIREQADSRELRGEVQGTQQDAHHADVKICFYHNGNSTTSPLVGDTVKVTVEYRYDWLHYLFAKAGIGPSTTIGSSSAMRLEALPTHYEASAGCPSTI